jgi:hypothetical protein
MGEHGLHYRVKIVGGRRKEKKTGMLHTREVQRLKGILVVREFCSTEVRSLICISIDSPGWQGLV